MDRQMSLALVSSGDGNFSHDKQANASRHDVRARDGCQGLCCFTIRKIHDRDGFCRYVVLPDFYIVDLYINSQ